MFSLIAEDENEHYNRLVELHKKLSARGDWPETIAAVVKGTNIMAVLLETAQVTPKTATPDDDDRQALRIAIDFETKGYNFYSALGRNAATASEKDFFSRLASIEREHLNALQESLLFFDNPADWFARHEKPGLEG
jgi:rubrerythrin